MTKGKHTVNSYEATEPDHLPGEIIKRDLARPLPVPLTTEELALRGRGIGEKSAELQKLREASADRARRDKERIKTAEEELEALMETCRTGTEDRLITCHERFHAGTVITVREDTWEVIGTPRAATPTERQLALPGTASNGGLLEHATEAQRQVGFEDDDDDDEEGFVPVDELAEEEPAAAPPAPSFGRKPTKRARKRS